MEKIKYSDIINHYLKIDYKLRSDILINLSLHIDKLYDNYILTTDERKKINSLINDTINNLNNYYNKISLIIFPDNKLDNYDIEHNDIIDKEYKLENDIVLNQMKNNFNYIIETIDILRLNNNINDFYPGLNIPNFHNIDIMIQKICNFVGLSSIQEIINIYIKNNSYIKMNDDEQNKFDIIKNVFVPFKSSYLKDKRLDKRNKTFEFINKKNVDEKYFFLLGNVFQIKLRINKLKTVLEINGYIELDSINSIIRTSQLCSNYLFNKKKIIIFELDKINDLDKNFKQSYIKNLTIGELLLFDEINAIKKITEDYNKYIKYTNMIFKSIMNDFIHSDIINKFEIIKFLLMGSSTSINIAALLFGITKDQKESIDNNSKPTLISDLIYKNLKFISQTKLKKSDTIILQELKKIDSMNINDIDLKKQIFTSKSMPDYVKKIALNRLDEIKSGSSENYKHLDYVKTLIDFPWINKDYSDIFSILNNDKENAKEFIGNAKNKMNEIIYGHDKCKETIIELIAKWISNPNSIGKSIGLRGPPGVGKTLFGKTLGDILNIPFAQINVGGIDDASILSGHSFTYSNAQPGLIIRKMTQAGYPRCIIFIDEIDKTGIKYGINEIMNILIHITDPNTNDNFNDKFFQEITFPLSKVLFIFSYNDQSKVDKILLDRLDQINVDPYTTYEKLQIFKNYILKEICDEINLDLNHIYIDDKTIEYLIENFTHESGVRNLKRKLEKILLKLNLDKIYSRGIFDVKNNSNNININITIDMIDSILDKPNNNIKKILSTSQIGIINGLYATDNGVGGILPILIYRNCNGTHKFKLKLTGSQKSVMKESIQFAFTIATNLLKTEIINKYIEENPDGLHIHTPDGATPKDGPSAGAAFTTAFISKILNIPIKNNIAMTGEIETNGMVTAIGGLESKLHGAKKAGVELVFIPFENKSDYDKIIKKNNKLICNNFNVKIVSHISEILDYALIDNTKNFTPDTKTFDYSKYCNIAFSS
jgi:endopeptidase La